MFFRYFSSGCEFSPSHRILVTVTSPRVDVMLTDKSEFSQLAQDLDAAGFWVRYHPVRVRRVMLEAGVREVRIGKMRVARLSPDVDTVADLSESDNNWPDSTVYYPGPGAVPKPPALSVVISPGTWLVSRTDACGGPSPDDFDKLFDTKEQVLEFVVSYLRNLDME